MADVVASVRTPVIDLARLEQLAAEAARTDIYTILQREQLAEACDPATVAALVHAARTLEHFANPQHWGITRGEQEPVPIWIGTYRQSPVDLAREALEPFRDAGAE